MTVRTRSDDDSVQAHHAGPTLGPLLAHTFVPHLEWDGSGFTGRLKERHALAKEQRSGPETMRADVILEEISAYCRREGMAESTFGRRAVNDGKFVNRLRFGGK